MKRLCILLLVFISLCSFGQTPTYKWIKKLPFSINSQCSDEEDNIYIAGLIEDTVIFENTILYPWNGHIVVAKIDSLGSLLWYHQLAPMLDNIVVGIQCDQNNDLVVLTQFDYSNIYFGDSLEAAGHGVVMIKYSKHGDLLWWEVPGYNDGGCFHAFSFTIDRENNIIISGNLQYGNYGIFPDTTITNDVISDFRAKYYPDGTFAWVRKSREGSDQITSDYSNNVLIFADTIQKYSANGQLTWKKATNLSMPDTFWPKVAADSADNSYISIHCDPLYIGNDTLTPGNSSQFLYIKLNSSGVPVLTRTARSTIAFQRNSISVNKNKVGITGTFRDKLFLDNDSLVSVSNVYQNSFVAVYDLAGNPQFLKKIDGTKGCSSQLITISKSIYVSGFSHDTIYFDNTVFISGQAPFSSCYFLARLQDEVVHPIFYPETFELFPNPTQGDLTIKINPAYSNATLEIYDMQGKTADMYYLETYSKSINLDHLTKGLYFIKIMTNEKAFISKFVKI